MLPTELRLCSLVILNQLIVYCVYSLFIPSSGILFHLLYDVYGREHTCVRMLTWRAEGGFVEPCVSVPQSPRQYIKTSGSMASVWDITDADLSILTEIVNVSV